MSKQPDFLDLPWDDIIIANILPLLTILDSLNLRCVSKSCMEIVDIYLHNLKDLDVFPKYLSRHALQVLGEKCRSLNKINVTDCALNDDDVTPLFKNNENLSVLQLNSSIKLTTKCLQPIILHNTNLRVLRMANCLWLDMKTLEQIALHHNNLEEIDISCAMRLSEDSIIMCLKKLDKLIILNLEGNKQVTDKCLCALSKYNKSLRILNISGCTQVTDKGVKSLVSLEELETLFVQYCEKITEDSLEILRPRTKVDRIVMDRWMRSVFIARGWIASPSGGLIMYDRKLQRYQACDAEKRGLVFVTSTPKPLLHGDFVEKNGV